MVAASFVRAKDEALEEGLPLAHIELCKLFVFFPLQLECYCSPMCDVTYFLLP